MLHDAQVVRDEQVGQAELLLQVLQQVDDLGLDGDVQRGYSLVADHQLRAQDQGAGDADPLALPARECVGIPGQRVRLHLHPIKDVQHGLRLDARVPILWMMRGSSRISCTVMRGFKDENGS